MRRILVLVLVLALALAQAGAFAQALAPARDGPLTPKPALPEAAFVQRPGAALPLAAPFTDSAGHVVRLTDELGHDGRPSLLLLGWNRCPQLCGLATQGALEAWRQSGLAPSATRLLFVSVDPDETSADAADRLRADLGYARALAGASDAPTAIERLVGPPASIRALADSVGFRWAPGHAHARLAHPAGLVVVTPDGRVSRYLMGVRFDPAELRIAVDDAAGDRIGTVSDRLALLCAHLDPRVGRHSGVVLIGTRIAGLVTLALLAAFAWRRRRTG